MRFNCGLWIASCGFSKPKVFKAHFSICNLQSEIRNRIVHLGEAPQLPAPEQVVGVVDGAVVGADHLPGADRVVVSVDPLVPSGAPPGMAGQERGAVVYAGQEFGEGLVCHEPLGRHRAFE